MEIVDVGLWLLNNIVLPVSIGLGWILWKLNRAVSDLRNQTEKHEVRVMGEIKSLEKTQATMQATHDNELGQFRGLIKDLKGELHDIRNEIKTVGERIYELLLKDRS